jgi:hypothetical protein
MITISQHNDEFELALSTIKAMEDIRSKFPVGNINHSLAIPFALKALNEYYSNDPVEHEYKNIAKSLDGLVFNIEIAINRRVLFVGHVIDPDYPTRPFPKIFDFAVIVSLNQQKLVEEVLMMEWERLAEHLSVDSRSGDLKVYLGKKFREDAIILFPRRGFNSAIKEHYNTYDGTFR